MNQTKFELSPIGRVETDENQGLFRIQIDEPFRPALLGLDCCTHAIFSGGPINTTIPKIGRTAW